MHELSIANSIVEIATEEARRRHAAHVTAVYLRIGPLSGVVSDALRFSYEVVCEGTPLAGSNLVIEELPVVVHCGSCDEQRTVDSMQHLLCPVCGALTPEVVQGGELEVTALEIV